MNFLFWNVHKNSSITKIINTLVDEHEIDVLILSEFDENPVKLLLELNKYAPSFFISPCGPDDRVKIFSKYDDKKIGNPIRESLYWNIRTIKYDSTAEIILVAVHLPSKLHTDEEMLRGQCQLLAEAISSVEDFLQHDNTLIVGDFNLNPFEKGMTSIFGLNSTMDSRIAKKKTRNSYDKSFKYFYNPLWSFMGDLSRGAVSGSYYYHNSAKAVSYDWNMFDQVLFRPSLIDFVNFDNIEILTTYNGQSLLTKNKLPNKEHISDHLPLKFSLNLT